jgi:tRNA(Ile)-lysidine synthase
MSHQPASTDKSSDLIERVAATVDRYRMFSPDEKVLVGVSGGPDSTALLHILLALAPRYHLKLAVAHLHHGLRADAADSDAAFVREMAHRMNLPIHEEKAIIQRDDGSIEEQAREARYGFFRRVMAAHGHTKIALGHQKNDNAEAVLMHLMRGSGIRGLGGIPPVRDGWVVRPLIDLERVEILAWLKKKTIGYVVDATNTDLSFERNRVRHRLIPMLAREFNPNIVDTLHRTADLCREEDAWLTRQLQPLLDKAVTFADDDRLQVDLPVISDTPLAAQRRLMREAIARWHGHLRRMTALHIDALTRLLPEDRLGKRISLPFGIEARRRTGHLLFTRGGRRGEQRTADAPSSLYKVGNQAAFPLAVDLPAASCRLVFETLAFGQHETVPAGVEDRAVFDWDALGFPLVIRNFKPGDRITPYGMQGSKKIKKIFIDRKISAEHRTKIPLLESDGEILWIAGVRRSDVALVTQSTRKVLAVRLERFTDTGIRHLDASKGDPSENHV